MRLAGVSQSKQSEQSKQPGIPGKTADGRRDKHELEDDALAMAFTNERRKLALEAAAGPWPLARVEGLEHEDILYLGSRTEASLCRPEER